MQRTGQKYVTKIYIYLFQERSRAEKEPCGHKRSVFRHIGDLVIEGHT